jgi:hypothetical protein
MRGADELLKLLHRALYGRPGTAHHVKQGIRIWNGLPTVTDGKDEVDPVSRINWLLLWVNINYVHIFTE